MHCVPSPRRWDETVNGAGLDGRLLCSAVCGMERFGTERFGIMQTAWGGREVKRQQGAGSGRENFPRLY